MAVIDEWHWPIARWKFDVPHEPSFLPVQPPIDVQQQRADRCREHDDQ